MKHWQDHQGNPTGVDMLLDSAESAPYVAMLLALVEPTKSLYSMSRLMGDATKKLAPAAKHCGLAISETDPIGKAKPTGFSVYSSREIPGMQEDEQGGVSHHATAPLSH
jgi:hypothetical protein